MGRIAIDGRTRPSIRSTIAVLAAFAVAFLSLRVAGITGQSATWDEPIHLTAGYAALTRGDYRVDPSHPPFARMWAALPLLAFRDVSLSTDALTRSNPQVWAVDWHNEALFSRAFVFTANDADRMIVAARVMIALLAVVGGIFVFLWADECFGRRAAILALAMFTLSPTIGAHAELVTTDVAEMTFFAGAAFFLWRVCRRGATAGNVAGLTVCVALSIVSKFSGLALVPIVGTLLAWSIWRRLLSPRRAATIAALLTFASWFAVWAVYGFREAPSADAGWMFNLTAHQATRAQAPLLSSIITVVDALHLLPNAFSQGLVAFVTSTTNPAYLFGEVSTTGWWYYFPAAFLVKSPAPFVILIVVGLTLMVLSRIESPDVALLLVPVLWFLGFAMASHINIGVRHILPIYPFLILVAAAAAEWMLATRRRTVRLALAALGVWWVTAVAHVYPFTLTFVSTLAGGPARGADYLADSNLDWGQGLKRLKSWMDGHDVDEINLAYFGLADPAYYGIHGPNLPGSIGHISAPRLPGYVAISETMASGVYLTPTWRRYYGAFRRQRPVAVIGNSIKVYWVDRWPTRDDAGADAPAAAPVTTVDPDDPAARR